MTSDLTFIGAGQMGMPMVERLLAAGHDVTVCARRAEVRAACEEAGASATDDLQGAVRTAEVVVVCLYSDAQLRELALGADGFVAAMREGTLLVVHTTGSPATARDLAEAGADRAVAVVDAPVSGSAQDIADGRVTVMLGGAERDVERARAVVSAYGEPVLAVGPLGSAQVVKLLNNSLFAAQVQLAAEVERIAIAAGVDPAQTAAAIQQSSGTSFALGAVARLGSAESFNAVAGHFLKKDVAAAVDVAAELGIDLGVLGLVNEQGPVTFAAR